MKKFTLIIIPVFIVLLSVGCEKDADIALDPKNVTLIAPLQDQACEQGINTVGDRSRIFFEWDRAENAQSYDLIVTDLETGENFITYEDIYDTRKELELIHNRAYSWQVVAKNNSSANTSSSPVWNFYFVGEPEENYAPFPANIITPQFGSTVEGISLNLEWEVSDPDGDSLTYTIYLDQIDGKQNPSANLTDLETNSISISVDSGATYYWRVKSSDGTSSSFSQIYTFSVK